MLFIHLRHGHKHDAALSTEWKKARKSVIAFDFPEYSNPNVWVCCRTTRSTVFLMKLPPVYADRITKDSRWWHWPFSNQYWAYQCWEISGRTLNSAKKRLAYNIFKKSHPASFLRQSQWFFNPMNNIFSMFSDGLDWWIHFSMATYWHGSGDGNVTPSFCSAFWSRLKYLNYRRSHNDIFYRHSWFPEGES